MIAAVRDCRKQSLRCNNIVGKNNTDNTTGAILIRHQSTKEKNYFQYYIL